MSQQILTINAGSSSLKFAIFDADSMDCTAIGMIDGLGTDPNFVMKDGDGSKLLSDMLEGDHFVADHAGALRTVLAAIAEHLPEARIVAVGHRVVHGGLVHSAPVVVDNDILRQLADLVPLAPLHQPHNLSGITAAKAAFPGVPQVACFDTAFHRAHPFVNDAFALPRALYDEGVRRYGFHGLSYEYVTGKLTEIAPDHAGDRIIICHLGSGASMCALRHGRSVASTMGFSALDGLPMGTRPGQIDPGVLLYLMDHKGMDAQAISNLLYKESGMKGLSGISNDMRDLEASDDPQAKQAVDYFVSSIRREIGAMTAVLGGLDAIVFCGGIGENSRTIRQSVLADMEWLGIEIDREANREGAELISSGGSLVSAFVIRTNEELMIARHTAECLARPTSLQNTGLTGKTPAQSY
ncbi:acetate kinase [Roseiarcaceae bacterium H3SJ34-1]|uniref:acetate/propionate family kinase n=1 Tax=Terripilifer ovatus TaxID=3032367 RepID=UPI003AB99A55|nr:acetate kinase [Roseiarcaceae bacterium H3SJ34-1]